MSNSLKHGKWRITSYGFKPTRTDSPFSSSVLNVDDTEDRIAFIEGSSTPVTMPGTSKMVNYSRISGSELLFQ